MGIFLTYMATIFFQAGAAQVDITPPLGTIINGDFVSHYAQYVHDALYAKALVLESQETTLAIVVVDICVIPRDLMDDAKKSIATQTGIPAQNILISSTHTHAAGSVSEVHLVGADLGYRNRLPDLIVEAVRVAHAQLRPAQIAFGTVDVPEHVVCRRYFMQESYVPVNPVTGETDKVKTNPLGAETCIGRRVATPDPEVSFLAVRETDGDWISLLANYGLHYVGDWPDGTLSADYFGEFSRQIAQKLQAGDRFVGMMSNGTSGDVNIWDFIDNSRYPTGHFEKSKLIAEDVAAQVFQATKNLSWQSNPLIAARFEEVEAAVNKPSPEELTTARQIVAESDYKRIIPDADGLRRMYAREQLMLNEFPNTVSCPVQAFRIGDIIIGTLPGEFFAETGLKLKADHPNYFSIGLANGNVGYVPPAAELRRGGYETWRCRISCLEEDAEQKIRDKLSRLICELENTS